MLKFYQKIFKAPKHAFCISSYYNFSTKIDSVTSRDRSNIHDSKLTGIEQASEIMSQLNDRVVSEEGEEHSIIDKPQLSIKDNVMYVTNLKEDVKFFSLIQVNNAVGLWIGVEKSLITALVIKGNATNFISNYDIKVPLASLGNVIDYSGQILSDTTNEKTIYPESDWENQTVDLIQGLQRAPYKRNLVSKQLYTGHLRIDLNQPMVQNNWILLKGPSNAGKDMVINSMISWFLKDDTDNTRRVVYVTPNYKGNCINQDMNIENASEKWTIITADSRSDNSTDLYLMPRTALLLAQKLRESKCDVLLVFDKIIEYDINEKRIFQNAKQPFGPTNIFNEIMENSGDFGPDQGTITSVLAIDTDTVNFTYDQAQMKLLIHLESIVDQIVNFSPELKPMKTYVPKLDLYEFCSANIDYWQKPLVASVRKDVEEFTKTLRSAFRQNHSKRELGIQEDPWENYLYHDAKFIIPLLNHKEPLSIIEQILLFKFIQTPLSDTSDPYLRWNDSISEFTDGPEQLK